MKKTFSIAVILLACISMAFAQKNKGNDTPASGNSGFDLQMEVYKTGLKYMDYGVATQALYNMMAMEPSRTDLKDSLVILYYAQGANVQCILLGDEVLGDGSKKPAIREMVAVSKQNVGLLKEALADYETLYQQTQDVYFLYQMAAMQYSLKRYGECVASLDALIGNPGAAEVSININNPNNTSQKVPLNAAAYNMRGVVALELGQNDNAKANFGKALELYPEFALAKGNMMQMEANSQAAPPASGQ